MNLFDKKYDLKSESKEPQFDDNNLGILIGDKPENVFAVLSRNYRIKNHAEKVFEKCIRDLELIDGAISELQLDTEGIRPTPVELMENDQLTWADARGVLTAQCGDYVSLWEASEALALAQLDEKLVTAKRIGF